MYKLYINIGRTYHNTVIAEHIIYKVIFHAVFLDKIGRNSEVKRLNRKVKTLAYRLDIGFFLCPELKKPALHIVRALEGFDFVIGVDNPAEPKKVLVPEPFDVAADLCLVADGKNYEISAVSEVKENTVCVGLAEFVDFYFFIRNIIINQKPRRIGLELCLLRADASNFFSTVFRELIKF